MHQILDIESAFQEDDRPWITPGTPKTPAALRAVMLLRRLVYALMTLYKHVTLRSEDNSAAPWRRLMKSVRKVLEWPNAEELENLRSRKFAVPPALA